MLSKNDNSIIQNKNPYRRLWIFYCCVIISLLVLSTVFAQVQQNVELIRTIGDPMVKRPYMIKIVDNYAYIADMALPGLVIFDVSNPAYPAFKGYAATPDQAWDVDVVGNYAYVAARNSGLIIFDISDPTNPESVGICVTTDNSLYGGENSGSRGVKVYSDYAYIGDSYGGLTIIDISDPTAPVKVANIGDPTMPSLRANRLDVVAPYCYVAAEEGLIIVDISDPVNPTIIGSKKWEITSSWYRCRGVRVFGRYAYISYGIRIIDISDPANPIQVGDYLGPYDYRNGWDNKTVQGQNAYYTFYAATHSLRVLDVNNPAFPQETGYYSHKAGVPEGRGIDVITKPDGFYIFMAGENPDIICIFKFTEVTDVEDKPQSFPVSYVLHQNYPNPFNPVTTIGYQLAKTGWVSLRVYDTKGHEVAFLVDGRQLVGSYQVSFDASELASGVYFYRLETASFRQVRKMVLIR